MLSLRNRYKIAYCIYSLINSIVSYPAVEAVSERDWKENKILI